MRVLAALRLLGLQGLRGHPQGPATLCFPPDPAPCLKQVKPPARPGRLLSAGHLGVRVERGTGRDMRDSEAEKGRAPQIQGTQKR